MPSTGCSNRRTKLKRLYPFVREFATGGIPVAVSWRVLRAPVSPNTGGLSGPVAGDELVEAYPQCAIRRES